MEEKKNNISEATGQEILRKQLELLAEASQNVGYEDLQSLTSAMVDVYDRLNTKSNYIPLEKSLNQNN